MQTAKSKNKVDLPPVETEANECLMPETDAVDTEICKLDSGKVAARDFAPSGSRRSISELDGLPYMSEMQAVEVAAAELKVI